MDNKKLNVLLVDDSPTARRALRAVLERARDMAVIGEATSGVEAVEQARRLQPDVVLMDIVMPEMDGLQATREIMHDTPTPIVLVSASLEGRETEIAFEAISAGALTVQRKPVGPLENGYKAQAAGLVNTVRAMAGVHVIHHWKRHRPRTAPLLETPSAPVEPPTGLMPVTPPQAVFIAASTGGPAALRTILSGLPEGFPLPVVVVQHIAADFVPSLAQWLPHITPLAVRIASEGERPQPGTAYLAPGGVHLRMDRQRRFVMDPEPRDRPHIPSCDVLLDSVASSYRDRAVGVILTGMGDDGARGLLAMRRAGAFTIAQNEATSVVYGMPREAVALGAVEQVLPLTDIPGVLTFLATMEGAGHE